MIRDPDREDRIEFHPTEVELDLHPTRRIDEIHIGPETNFVVTDTFFPVECTYCEASFIAPTKWQAETKFSNHVQEIHRDKPHQYVIPDWYRRYRDSDDKMTELQRVRKRLGDVVFNERD